MAQPDFNFVGIAKLFPDKNKHTSRESAGEEFVTLVLAAKYEAR